MEHLQPRRHHIRERDTPPHTLEPDGHDSLVVRGGADLRLGDAIHVRGGLIYDETAIPAEGLGPALPDANRLDAAAGVGLAKGRWGADLGYLFVYFLPAEATSGREGPSGTYRSVAHLVALTARVSWP